MAPTEADLLAEFEIVVLELLVPFWVQARIPQVRQLWREVLATKEGAKALDAAFTRVLKSKRGTAEAIRALIAKSDPGIMNLKKALYGRMARRQDLFTAFVGRPVTNGNEECPYWTGFAYTRPPRRT